VEHMENDIKQAIYELESKYKRIIEILRKDKRILQKNKELFLDFADSCLAQGISKHRIIIYLRHLRNLAINSDMEFNKEMTRKDMERIMARVMNSKHYSDWSKETFKSTIKKYFRWLYNLDSGDPLPDVVKWIKGSSPPNRLTKDDLITQDEVQSMINATSNVMYKAMLSTLYEGALRPGELLSMHINDVIFEDSYVTIKIRGKMERKIGEREVYLVNSYDLLRAWIDQHPFKRFNHPLWIVTTHQKIKTERGEEDLYGKPISLRFLDKMIKDLAVKANVKTYVNKKGKLVSKVYPYLFRHSRGTVLYKEIGEALAKKFMDHVPDSKMAKVYNHLNDEDVLEAIRQKHGLIEEENRKESSKICPRCRHSNSYGASLCSKCGMALSLNDAVNIMVRQEDKQTEMIRNFVNLLESNPLIMQLLRDPKIIEKMIEERANRMFDEWKRQTASSTGI